jgi:hypothetical protein
LSQTNNLLQIGVTTRKLFHVQASTGSSYTLLSNGVFTPITQQGLDLIWNYNSATPTSISFNSGRFGPGRLNSWTRSSTLRAGERGSFTVEADDTDQHTDKGQRFVQWLERASFSYQMSRDSSLALGVRRIIGVPPELDAPQQFVNAWNLSAAFHRKVPGGEVYIVYGDASTLYTVPQFIVKFIKYVGADKGT